jgi:OOP family OmpA-OmpF porin
MLVLAGLGPLIATPLLAQDGLYGYGGVSIGNARARLNEQRAADTVLGGGVTATNLQRDRDHMAYRLFGGVQVNHVLGFEVGYFDLGNFSFNSGTSAGGTLAGKLKVQGASFDAVATLPFTERLAGLARAGATYAKSRGTFNGVPPVADASPSKREANPKVGLGLQYAFTPSLLLRGEVERYRVNDAVGHRGNVDVMNVSLVMPFGRSAAPGPRAMAPMPMTMAQSAPAPEVVVAPPAPVIAAPAPMPEPVAQAVPPPAAVFEPARRRVSYSAESLFDFDASAMLPAGKQHLDTFARELEGTTYVTVTVEGHTDRLGSPAYNQALSQRRADAVKEYLVATGKLDASKISAVGKSESQPLTKAADCVGNQQTAQLVACLQPDRRVEIEVVGSR